MTQFLSGKLKQQGNGDLLDTQKNRTVPLQFSEEAKEVFNAGKSLWKYYHQQPSCNVNASLYDIKEHFQGRNEKGRMNNKSDDPTYMNLLITLREKLNTLAKKLQPKVYEHGFLRR